MMTFSVGVQCMTYNHSKYILDALNGFVMQETDFPFIILLVDDASTDDNCLLIKDYLIKNFRVNDHNTAYEKETDYAFISYAQHNSNLNCFIAAIYLKYNHYQIGKKMEKLEYLSEWLSNCKYVALCEGDDYWTDPLKLQKQVEFMEHHPDYTMCCTDAVISAGHNELDWKRYYKNCQIPTKDIIMGGGLFIQTATLLYRLNLVLDGTYPESAKKCHVGDYPLQIYAALKGKVFWFADKMSVYRFQVEGSWTSAKMSKTCTDKMIKGWQSEINMLKGMDRLSQGIYHDVFNQRIAIYVLGIIRRYRANTSRLTRVFANEIELFSYEQKLRLFLLRLGFDRVYNLLAKIYHRLHNSQIYGRK